MDDEGKKHPMLPSNYVTLAQLQDRWLKERQRKQQEKEEEERKQRDKEEKKYPLLPSNYVTLTQLQDRWLKERQRKQQEKEEEERKQRDKEKQDRKREEDQQNQKGRNQNRDRNNANTVPRRPLHPNHRIRPERGPGTVRVSDRKPEEMRIGPIVVVADALNRRMLKGKRESRAEEGQTGSSEQLFPEKKAEGKIPVAVIDENSAKKVSSEIRPNGKNMMTSARAWDKKVPAHRSAEIGLKFADISLSGGRGGYGRPSGRMRGGGYRDYNRRFERFNSSKPEKLKHSNVVWVRKGDISDINVA